MSNQWVRKILLVVHNMTPTTGLDLSALRIKFNIQNADVETPNNAFIRVYNLDGKTVKKITGSTSGEFAKVTLTAGYVNGSFGVIFSGTIRQYRIGKENNKDSYLDILASDGDIGYNQAVVNKAYAKGSKPEQFLDDLGTSLQASPDIQINNTLASGAIINPSIRGVVLVGMARARLRNQVNSLDASWSLQGGVVTIIPYTGYAFKDEEVPVINSNTGMIGVPEQTQEGIKVTCLLNSKLRIGGRVKLNNDDIIQTLRSTDKLSGVAFNSNTNLIYYVPTGADGTYRCYVVEHEGDTRGQAWYTHLVCLAVHPSAPAGQQVANS